MTHYEFVKSYNDIVRRALALSEKSRGEGLLALLEELDQEKSDNRDIFEYGLSFVMHGTDKEFIEKILSNIINHEKDEDMRILKTIQKEAVLLIQEGINPRVLYSVLNSYTNIIVKDDEMKKLMEDYIFQEMKE